jgi:hypothetical protein
MAKTTVTSGTERDGVLFICRGTSEENESKQISQKQTELRSAPAQVSHKIAEANLFGNVIFGC